MAITQIGEVLRFWFEETPQERWFAKDADFDAEITRRFGALWRQAAEGACEAWADTAEGALALVILLDQFPRNMFRDTPTAFASDARALAVARAALGRDFDLELPPERRIFLYLPFEHSEDLADQKRACELVEERVGPGLFLDFAIRHREVIERFGRFPHRNAILGRPSTPEEERYLAEPGAGF